MNVVLQKLKNDLENRRVSDELLIRTIVSRESANIKKLNADERDACVQELVSYVNSIIRKDILPQIKNLNGTLENFEKNILNREQKRLDYFVEMKDKILSLKSESYRESLATILTDPDVKNQDTKSKIEEILPQVVSLDEIETANKYIDILMQDENSDRKYKSVLTEIKKLVAAKKEDLGYGEWKPGFEITYDTSGKSSAPESMAQDTQEETEFEYDDDDEIIVTDFKDEEGLPILSKSSKSSDLIFSESLRREEMRKLDKKISNESKNSEKSVSNTNSNQVSGGNKQSDSTSLPPRPNRPAPLPPAPNRPAPRP